MQRQKNTRTARGTAKTLIKYLYCNLKMTLLLIILPLCKAASEFGSRDCHLLTNLY